MIWSNVKSDLYFLGGCRLIGVWIYINDIPENTAHKFRLIADDGKFTVELGIDRDDDCMKSEINRIVKWSVTWSMELITEKDNAIWYTIKPRRLFHFRKKERTYRI